MLLVMEVSGEVVWRLRVVEVVDDKVPMVVVVVVVEIAVEFHSVLVREAREAFVVLTGTTVVTSALSWLPLAVFVVVVTDELAVEGLGTLGVGGRLGGADDVVGKNEEVVGGSGRFGVGDSRVVER